MSGHDTPTARNATVIRLLLIGALTFSASALLPLEQGPALPALKATACSVAAVLAVLLARPQHGEPVTRTLIWCAAGVLFAAFFILSNSATRVLWPDLPRLVITLFLLSATLAVAGRLLSTPIIVASFAMLTLMPVWAAPLVEVMANPEWLNKIVINASPLTAIAVAIDFDYLRSEWFYANSALGSMRYSYPGWIPVIVSLAVVPAAAISIDRLRSRPPAIFAFRKEVHL